MKKIKRTLCIMFALVFVVASLAACGGSSSETTTQAAASETTAAAAETEAGLVETTASGEAVEGTSDETLTIALSAEPKVTDGIYGMGQQASEVAFSIYDGLVEWNSETETFDPMLAESWEQIDDCTTRFYLRKDVTFHDGTPFNADAVIWNFENIRDNSAAATSYVSNFDIDNFNVIDDYTIDIVTYEPYVLTMTALSLNYFLMMSPTAVEAVGGEEHTRNPLGGSGPYKFVEWNSGSYILLERNDDYYGELPYYKTLKYVFISDDTARGLALESGDVDIIENALESQAKEYQNGDTLDVYVPAKITAYALWFNAREGRATNDIKVRQAIAYAIERTGLPEILDMPSSVSVADGIQPQESVAYRAPANGYYDFDLAKAQSLLEEAGYKDGLTLQMFYPEGQMYQTLAEYIQYSLQQININVELESISMSAATEKQSGGEYDMYLQRTSVYDPNISGIQWFKSGLPTNRTGYSSATLDAAAEKCYGTSDEDVFTENFMDFCDVLRDEVPALYLVHATNLFAYKAGLTGLYTEKMLCGIYTHIRPTK